MIKHLPWGRRDCHSFGSGAAPISSRLVITLDSDFHTILALTNAAGPSVIRIRWEGLRGPDLALLIKEFWPKVEPRLKQGALVSVSDSGIRIRNIPLFPA